VWPSRLAYQLPTALCGLCSGCDRAALCHVWCPQRSQINQSVYTSTNVDKKSRQHARGSPTVRVLLINTAGIPEL
jgi:hypothetical protein